MNITMTLAEFEKDYKGTHNLYIVWRGSECLYVGISISNVWNRWFLGTSPHMFKNNGGHWRGDYSTLIGREIISNMPASWNWTIELRNIPENKLRDTEAILIKDLHPKLNTMLSR